MTMGTDGGQWNDGGDGDTTQYPVPVCSSKYDAMMVMEMIAVLTIICYQTDEKSIITGRQQIIIYVTPRIFSRESCERNILLFIIFKIFSFHFALGSFQKYGGVLSW